MAKNTLDGPTSLNLNPKPKGLVLVRKFPLIVGVVIFLMIIIGMIFHISYKQKRERTKKKDAKINSVVMGHEGLNQWFNATQYDSLHMPVAPLVIQKDLLDGDIVEQFKSKDSLNIQNLKTIEDEKAYANALQSPVKILQSFSYQDTPSSTIEYKNEEDYASSLSASVLDRLGTRTELSEQDRKRKFLKESVADDFYLTNIVTKPLSEYELKSGSIIPAVLIQGINSDLPGSITAQVRANVYDSRSGQYLLIPQGTKIIGTYDSDIGVGQSRSLVVWHRLIFPNQESLNLDAMQGVDVSGYAGFKGKVNNHYARVYGNALLMSLLGGGSELLQKNTDKNSAQGTIVSSVGQQFTQVSSEVIRESLKVQPTITIPVGYKFSVQIIRDIILEVYRNDER